MSSLQRRCEALRKQIEEEQQRVDEAHDKYVAAKATEEADKPESGVESVEGFGTCMGLELTASVAATEISTLGKLTKVLGGAGGTAWILSCGTESMHKAIEAHERYDKDVEARHQAFNEWQAKVETLKALKQQWKDNCYHKCGALGGLGFRWPQDDKCAGHQDWRLHHHDD